MTINGESVRNVPDATTTPLINVLINKNMGIKLMSLVFPSLKSKWIKLDVGIYSNNIKSAPTAYHYISYFIHFISFISSIHNTINKQRG